MNAVTDNLGLYGTGVLTTLQISLLSGIGALVLGTIMAGFRVSPAPPLQWVGSAWVTVLRNTPLSVVLFTIAFGLPEIGVNGSFFWFGVTGLALYTSAFVCEAIRSGINSVAPGQAEAARSVGMTFGQTLTVVVLPQAVRTVVPPLGNVFIAMIKNSAIVGAVGVGGDLYSVGVQLTGSGGLAVIPVLIGVALGYLVLTIPAGLLLGLAERKVAIAR
ncbi:amino acid ABC transporter permease [Pseudonocardia sp. KRD-184]|uniref:Amino acid ABC transporter permease n=1 Tax=Pseudonocardia oceani TaxID=2792013 RepID=A0ABS6U5G0_9PSEU|nr:amino acid ABC transporter permease [Pseudonocardia oceani]MBW0090141.1 amino acid ABC transporter permease [Pseudonocardia oceani]MBW0097309.1 amino acid ABC transporter permease [Pseudonocardia oceani]MBW0124055.1 amino acid ABC transporter permease [Pseudonocardia oceani]MBW0127139.1 amino acid ABC transporter permease [Pseudonocardia oceani]